MIPLPSTAMIMAAGMGTRMKPLTDDRPKPLVTVGETTLIDHVLDHLRHAGVGRIVVNVHYRADMIEAHLASHATDFDVAVSDERDTLLETGGGLMRAMPLLQADPFFCVNADNVWLDDGANVFCRLAECWDEAAMDGLMLLVPTRHAGGHSGSGDFDMDDDGRLSRDSAATTRPWVWTGIQLLSQRMLVDPPGPAFSTNIFWNRAIVSGRLFGIVHHGPWFDVGTPAAIPLAVAAICADRRCDG